MISVPANRKIVVAENYSSFKRFVDHDADPRILHTFAQDATAFVGRTFTNEQIVFLDGWSEHPKAKEIIEQVNLRLALNGARK
ncbi:hypothetical protein SEA_PUREGLOBE5_13 [Arthrobacter phage Pureglobe5]|nr:hypothetical protein SEA_ODYSSEY395_13 [Arthrobacter phage Odyssey395]UYL87376.1 hypothetical protein SEA_PUREGLOBE5_13 [Arthrobacter phage Pureglobe5]